MSVAQRFLKEAMSFLGEQEDDKKNDDVAAVDDMAVDGGAAAGGDELDDLDIGEPAVDANAANIHIEKDGDIVINKGAVQLTVADDGSVDINLDNLEADLETPELMDASDKGEEPAPNAEDDSYNIDWKKEEESGLEPQEGFSKASRAALTIKITEGCNEASCDECDKFDECNEPGKHKGSGEEADFLTQNYL